MPFMIAGARTKYDNGGIPSTLDADSYCLRNLQSCIGVLCTPGHPHDSN